jgi:1-aminocyclopropane-1-carboxylate deaminase/D-cysteine desulfhydrase-like pyridoxal-dependent ACC family enzyme
VAKTRSLLHGLDPTFVADGWEDRIVWRDEFLAGGYARVDEATRTAVSVASDQLHLDLETTYTGKAFAALLKDLGTDEGAGRRFLFWNTYNAQPLPVSAKRPASLAGLPDEFARYYFQ